MPSESNAIASLDDLSFEEALTQLQDIVLELESGDLTLDATIDRYETGAALAAHCQRLMAEAELRITELDPTDPGSPLS